MGIYNYNLTLNQPIKTWIYGSNIVNYKFPVVSGRAIKIEFFSARATAVGDYKYGDAPYGTLPSSNFSIHKTNDANDTLDLLGSMSDDIYTLDMIPDYTGYMQIVFPQNSVVGTCILNVECDTGTPFPKKLIMQNVKSVFLRGEELNPDDFTIDLLMSDGSIINLPVTPATVNTEGDYNEAFKISDVNTWRAGEYGKYDITYKDLTSNITIQFIKTYEVTQPDVTEIELVDIPAGEIPYFHIGESPNLE